MKPTDILIMVFGVTCIGASVALAVASPVDPIDTPYIVTIDGDDYGAVTAPSVTPAAPPWMHVVWQNRYGETEEAWVTDSVRVTRQDAE